MTQNLLLHVSLLFTLISLPSNATSFKKAVLKTIVKYHNANSGSTFHPATGANYAKKDGFAVAIMLDRSHTVEGPKITTKELKEFLKFNEFIFDPWLSNQNDLENSSPKANFLVGTWYEKGANLTWIEITQVLPEIDHAMKLADDHAQEWIYDLNEDKAINVQEFLYQN